MLGGGFVCLFFVAFFFIFDKHQVNCVPFVFVAFEDIKIRIWNER
jgi:hypothetical protein